MAPIHHDLCPVMEEGCHSVGGYDKYHNRGVKGNCRCGQRCQCELIYKVIEAVESNDKD